jgi:hypothetical protein
VEELVVPWKVLHGSVDAKKHRQAYETFRNVFHYMNVNNERISICSFTLYIFS